VSTALKATGGLGYELSGYSAAMLAATEAETPSLETMTFW
jgi:NAD(P)H-hydrate repair Nnr-like enzyme with NAD(P)H-hydrate dehydratase domain